MLTLSPEKLFGVPELFDFSSSCEGECGGFILKMHGFEMIIKSHADVKELNNDYNGGRGPNPCSSRVCKSCSDDSGPL
jgi:hypothetical protein